MGKSENKMSQRMGTAGPLGFAFFVSFFGAAMYFVHQSSGFWGFFGAILKAVVWPGFVVYHVLGLLNA
jgi:hypothetical protein